MNNFMDFVIEDITVKKELLSTMPLNNKTNIKKYNEKISLIQDKYKIYKKSMLTYIKEVDEKIVIEESANNAEKILEKIKILETGIKYFDPYMSANEKCGFEGLKYNLKHFNDYNFESMNRIIDAYIKKFEIAGIKITPDDFPTTIYSNQYMKAFINHRNINGTDDFESLSELFEKLYWKNPDIVLQIAEDFETALEKYEDALVDYIEDKKFEFTKNYKFKNYDECKITLKKAHERLIEEQKETVYDIINLARNGELEINNYKADAKVRLDVLNELVIDYNSIKEDIQMDRVFEHLTLLEQNIQEYIDYNKLLPLIETFKNNYQEFVKQSGEVVEDIKDEEKEAKIKGKKPKKSKENIDEEKELTRILNEIKENNNIIKKGRKRFKKISEKEKEALIEKSLDLAKELRLLKQKIKREKIKERIDMIFEKKPVTIETTLQILYRFSQMKRELIRQVYSPDHTIEEMVDYYHKFDSYANDPNHYILNNTFLFEESNISDILINNYRLKGIKITEENLRPENLEDLLNKIKMLIRIDTIKKSPVSADDIWFKLQVEKILEKEEPKKTEE